MVQDRAIITTVKTNRKLYMVYITSIGWCHIQRPWMTTQISSVCHYLTLSISEMVQDRHSYNGILIGTYTKPTRQCSFKILWHSTTQCRATTVTAELLVITVFMSFLQYYFLSVQCWRIQIRTTR